MSWMTTSDCMYPSIITARRCLKAGLWPLTGWTVGKIEKEKAHDMKRTYIVSIRKVNEWINVDVLRKSILL